MKAVGGSEFTIKDLRNVKLKATEQRANEQFELGELMTSI